ncbi:MAG TPA: hypothetical protein VEA40_00555 [Ramlibacter sp.]|nr:hypothetical protein [Ramlibacter sp.]
MVEREEHTRFSCTPNAATPIAVRRSPAGSWVVDLKVDVQIDLPDGRSVMVAKVVTVKATRYVGFKKRGPTVARIAAAGGQEVPHD